MDSADWKTKAFVCFFWLAICLGGYWVFSSIKAQGELLEELQRKLEALDAKIEKAEVTVCNLSLSTVGWGVVVRVSRDRVRLVAESSRSGTCTDVVVYHRPGFGEIYVHGIAYEHDAVAVAASRMVNSFYGDELAKEDRVEISSGRDVVYYHGSADVTYCSGSYQGLGERGRLFASDEDCAKGAVLQGYGLAWRSDGRSRKWTYAFEMANWPLLQGNSLDGLELALLQLKGLRGAVERQMEEERELAGRTVVGYLGGSLEDSNSPLSPGVYVQSAMAEDIFGGAQLFGAGDTILAVNGKPVFGLIDLEAEIQRHAMDLARGINKPLNLKIVGERCPETCSVPAYYFFNERYSGQASQGEAMAWGISNAFLYGQATWVGCVGTEIGKGVVNMGGAFWEGLSSGWNHREIDRSKFEVFKQRTQQELKQCIWDDEQRSALAQQTQKQYYAQAETLGLWLPSGAGSYFARPFIKQLGKRVVLKAGTRALASAVLAEAIETSLWSFGSGPPGRTLGERIKSVKSDLPYAVGFGVAGGTLMGAKASKAKFAGGH